MFNRHLGFFPPIRASPLHPISAAVRLMCVLFMVTSSTSLASGKLEIYPRIYDEQAPAGGMIQLKVKLTEPRPITVGRTTLGPDSGGQGASQPLGDVAGVALFGPAGDVSGAAVVSGNWL